MPTFASLVTTLFKCLGTHLISLVTNQICVLCDVSTVTLCVWKELSAETIWQYQYQEYSIHELTADVYLDFLWPLLG